MKIAREGKVFHLFKGLIITFNSQFRKLTGFNLALQNSPVKAFITNANYGQRFDYVGDWAIGRVLPTRPLRVMMLGLRGFPNVQGGIETHAEHLAPLLVRQGCDLEVIVRSPYQNAETGKEWCGVKLTKLWAPKSRGLEAFVHTFLGVLYAAIKRPDILHIHAIGPALMTPLARLLGLKVVVTHHGPDYNRQKWGAFARAILKLGECLGMRFSNSRIVISNTIRELVACKHTMQSTLIHNGVLIPNLDTPETYLKEFGIQKNQYILLVSRLVPEKRHLDLIDAFNQAELDGYKLVLVGSSDYPDAYMQSVIDAASASKNVVMTGFQAGDVLRSLYTHAALFVLPSSHEGLSISLLEALSYGLPVIASNIAPNLEVGLDANHYFELGNVDELAKLLAEKLRQSLSTATRIDTRAWVNGRYNWERIAEKTYKEYQSIL
jgi:glycosyltransferase involved in cell wall biosynthesis